MPFILQIKTRGDAKSQHSEKNSVVLGAASRIAGVNEPNLRPVEPAQQQQGQHLFGLHGFNAPQTEMYAVPTPVGLRQPLPTAVLTTRVNVGAQQQHQQQQQQQLQQQQQQQQQEINSVKDFQNYTPLVYTMPQQPGAPAGPSGPSPDYLTPSPPTYPTYVNDVICKPQLPARRNQ